MNDERRALLIAQHVRMALACHRVAPLAKFYLAKARALIPPPSMPVSASARAPVEGRAGGGLR